MISTSQPLARHVAVALGLAGVALVTTHQARSYEPEEPIEHAQKRAHASPSGPIVQPVDLATAAAHATLDAVGALPTSARSRLADLMAGSGAPPVLLPERPDLLATAQVVSGAHWYSVAMKGPDFNVVVTGNAAAISVPSLRVAPEAVASPERPHLTRVHDIVTVTFTAWGVAYDVDIECLGGVEHPLCGDDGLALDLVASLRRLDPDDVRRAK